MSGTLKARIIAMKRANPKLWPAQIAKELGCKRGYVSKMLALMDEDERSSVGQPHISNPKAIGSGRAQVAGYLRLM